MNRNDIQLPQWKPKSWDSSRVDESLAELLAYAEHNAEAAINWYYNKKRPKAWLSRGLRFLTILSAALGALIPIMVSAGWLSWFHAGSADETIRNLQLNHYGYILIGLAALFLALDRFSASSTSWMRYITTAMTLQTEVEKFRFDWERLTASLAGRKPEGEILLSLIRRITEFGVAVRALVESETKAWVGEFQSNLTELEKQSEAAWEAARSHSEATQKQIDSQRAAARRGAIELAVENALDTDDGYEVRIDGESMKLNITTKTCGLLGIPSGLHELSVVATLGGMPAHASQIVQVSDNAVINAQLTLEKKKPDIAKTKAA